MRAIFLSTFLLIFFLFSSSLGAFAQETMQPDEVSPTVAPSQVEYILPYPGLLPDNPLYLIKSARDSIVGFLISSPDKKAEFNLHQADKYLQSAQFLANKDKTKLPLALTTLQKGSNNFEIAVRSMQDAKKQKFVVSDVVNRLSLSARKHKEVYQEMQEKFPTAKDELMQLERKMSEFEKTANSFRR